MISDGRAYGKAMETGREPYFYKGVPRVEQATAE